MGGPESLLELLMARFITVAAVLLVFTAFACAEFTSIPEFSQQEPELMDELVQEQVAPEAPVVSQSKVTKPLPNQEDDVETFKVVNKKHVAVPPQAGDKEEYKKQKNTEKSLRMNSSAAGTTNAEQAAGLKAAANIMHREEVDNERQAESHKVAEAMNYAAEMAADYKTMVELKSKADMVVKKAQLEVQSQEQVVNNFNKQLQCRFKMEHAGDVYARAKAKAIGIDNEHKQHVEQERKNKTFAKVAENAVKNFKKKHAKKKKPVKKKPAKQPKTACNNCVTLPKAYKEDFGEEGSCADCPKWAKKGYCLHKNFGKFMSDYCARSCKRITGKCGNAPQ